MRERGSGRPQVRRQMQPSKFGAPRDCKAPGIHPERPILTLTSVWAFAMAEFQKLKVHASHWGRSHHGRGGGNANMAKKTKFVATSTIRVGVASERLARGRVCTSTTPNNWRPDHFTHTAMAPLPFASWQRHGHQCRRDHYAMSQTRHMLVRTSATRVISNRTSSIAKHRPTFHASSDWWADDALDWTSYS